MSASLLVWEKNWQLGARGISNYTPAPSVRSGRQLGKGEEQAAGSTGSSWRLSAPEDLGKRLGAPGHRAEATWLSTWVGSCL